MGFFASLRRALGTAPELASEERERLSQAWKQYEDTTCELPTTPRSSARVAIDAAGPGNVQYDATHWRKKLKTFLERLPDSRDEWDDIASDANALGFDPGWVDRAKKQEFTLLVRRAVADARVTKEEHEVLELARSLLGLTDDDAERTLHEVFAEAEEFFGKPIRGAAR